MMCQSIPYRETISIYIIQRLQKLLELLLPAQCVLTQLSELEGKSQSLDLL